MLPEHWSLMRKAAEVAGIEDFVLSEEQFDGATGHYFGIIKPIVLRSKSGKVAVRLVLKSAQTSEEEVRKARAISAAFEREVKIYRVVLPALLSFQEELTSSHLYNGIPRCYATSLEQGREALILDDLRATGYRLWHSQQGMDFNHLAPVIREYGRLHALSLAFRAMCPDKFLELTKDIKLNFLEQREQLNPDLYEQQRKVVFEMSRKAVRGNQKAQEAQEKFEKDYPRFWRLNKENSQEGVVVVCHGDSHPGNIMFQYDDNGKPQKVCLLDWQLSSAASPARDLTFLLFTCASKENLLRHEDFLRIYHDTIASILAEFGLDVEKIFNYKEVKEQWSKYLLYGLYRALVVLKITLVSPEELHDLGEACSILDVLKRDFSLQSPFADRVRNLFEVVNNEL